MSKELMHILITKMNVRLNQIIEKNSYNLLNYEVQHYSRRLDKALMHYEKMIEKQKLPPFIPRALDENAHLSCASK